MSEWRYSGALRLSRNGNTVGIPFYTNRIDNYAYVPETDIELRITDFVRIENLEDYATDYLCGLEFQRAPSGVGQPIVIPLWIDDRASAFLSDIEPQELNALFPPPKHSVDVLRSLRDILEARANGFEDVPDQAGDETRLDITALASLPVSNTKNWVNRFKIASGRAPNSPPLNADNQAVVRSLATRWLTDWHRKGSFALSLEILGGGVAGYLSRSETEHIVFTQYIDRFVRGYGKPIPPKDIKIAHRRFFKQGLSSYLKESYRPYAHQKLFDELKLRPLAYDEVKIELENYYSKRARVALSDYRLDDALALTIQVYGNEAIPSTVGDLVFRLIDKLETTFYPGLNQLRFHDDRSVQGHADAFHLASELAAIGYAIETLHRIIRAESRITGSARKRIDHEAIRDLNQLAERHLILSQARSAGN